MKYANFAIAAVCFLFAYFQWNDPDPMLWIALYGSIGVVATLAGLGKHWMVITGLLAVACIYLMGMSHQGVWDYLNNVDGQTLSNAMSKEHPYIEETREYGGAVVALVFLAVIAWTSGCCRKPRVQLDR